MLGGGKSEAQAINNKGQIVGGAEATGLQTHAFLWEADGGMVDLGSLYGARSLAKDINEKGQVVGLVVTGLKDHAFYWDSDAGMVDLVGANGPSSTANSINDAGRIAGYIFDAQKNNYDACMWAGKDGIERLNIQAAESYAGGINDRGETIGYIKTEKVLFFRAQSYYFLRSAKGGIINLDKYTPSKQQRLQVCGINNLGWMVGESRVSRKNVHRAILIKPKRLFRGCVAGDRGD